METIKSYTDLSKSKKLAEILPHESADMVYFGIHQGMDGKYYLSGTNTEDDVIPIYKNFCIKVFTKTTESDVINQLPCWSLTSLLSILPYKIKLSHDVIDANGNLAYKNECYKFSINRCGLFGDKWNVQYYGKHQRQLGKRYKELYIDLLFSENYNNLVDACYEMILKLNELKML